ncbi:hypothetical protein M5K25_027870 [Dendrobium thyrsiflorum]|uniref:Uncharacterized protein n=1 Tax=Dendrobium thyrsiflorum TaxID=117978 RepID=A0ABD0TUY2_DENTH
MDVSGNSSLPRRPHVALFAFPFTSHVSSIYSLARAFATAAPSAIFSFVSTAKTLESLPRTAGNLRLLPFEEEIPDGGSSAGFEEVIGRFLEAAPGKIRAAANAAAVDVGGIPVSCVLSDAFMWMADFVAEEMEVRWVALFLGFPLALLAHTHTDDLRSRFDSEDQVMPTHADKLLQFIPGLATIRVSVLSHPAVGVFVTHCGWKSIRESIMSDMVMLCRPIFADQKMIARVVELMWGVGTNLNSGITREAFVGAMDAILKGDDGKKMRKRVVEIRERTEKALLPGGSLSVNLKSLVELVCRI